MCDVILYQRSLNHRGTTHLKRFSNRQVRDLALRPARPHQPLTAAKTSARLPRHGALLFRTVQLGSSGALYSFPIAAVDMV